MVVKERSKIQRKNELVTLNFSGKKFFNQMRVARAQNAEHKQSIELILSISFRIKYKYN